MSKKSSYFSNYESPNIVIVPTVNFVVVNKLHDTAAVVANTYSSTSQHITNKSSSVSLETRVNDLVNYDENVTVSGGIVGNLGEDALKHHSILPVFSNEVNFKQETKSPWHNSSENLADLFKSVSETSNKEQVNNTNEASKEYMQRNEFFLESVVSENQSSNLSISQINMTSTDKPDKMREKIKCSYDNDDKNYSHNALQEKQMNGQQPSCSSSQQPSCSSNKKLEEECTNKDKDMKKYLKQLWTRRIEKMKEKRSNEKIYTNVSAKQISKTKSSKTSKDNMTRMEQKNKLLDTELNNELNNYNTLSEAQKNNLTPGALKRYLDYQRFLQNYHKNLKIKQQVNNDNQKKCFNSDSLKKIHKSELKEKIKEIKSKKSSLSEAPSKQKMKELNEHLTKRIESVKDMKKMKIKRKERTEEANEKSTSTIERKKIKDDSSRKSNSTENINKKKKISSYVKKNQEEGNQNKSHYEHQRKIKTQSNDGISRKPHVKKEGNRNNTDKINNYFARKKIEEESKVIRKKPLKRLSTNVAELNDIKRKNKIGDSPLRTTDIRKRLTSRNITKNCNGEMDLRSILSRKRTKSQCSGESKRFRPSTPPRENLIITVKQDIVPKTSVNKITANKAKENKFKKMKLVINISCPNSNDSDTSNESSSPLQDLSFLDDIDIDGIVDSLDVGSTNCETNDSTKEDFVPADLCENTLNNTIMEVMKNECQLNNINELSMNIEESKARFTVSVHNSDEESNHSIKTQHDIKTEVEHIGNSEDTTAISPTPINDDVYEIIDITNDTEVIDLSDDQREQEDEDTDVKTPLTTTKEIKEDIDDESIILINDDSKDGMETPHTLDNTQDNEQDLVFLDDSDVVVIEDNFIDDNKLAVSENNHFNTQNCPESLKKIEDTTESKPKLEELNTTVNLDEESEDKERQYNEDEHHNYSVNIIPRNIKIEQLGLTENICDMEQSNECSLVKKSINCMANTRTRTLEDSFYNRQLQAAAMKNSNGPTDLNTKSDPTSTNDKLIKTEVSSNDIINNITKTVSTKELPVASADKRIKSEVTSEINELPSAVVKNNLKTGANKITSIEPGKLNTNTPPVITNDKLIKTEAISEINELQLALMKDNTSKISSNKPCNVNTKAPPVVANDKVIKTEKTSEINILQPAILKNNAITGHSITSPNEVANLNTKTSLEATYDKLIKKEAITEIEKLQPVTTNNPANLSAATAANGKPIKTEAILEINKSQPVETKSITDSVYNKITSNKPANLNKTSALIAANEKPVKKEATLEINKSQPAVTKNNTDSGSHKITSNKPANLNKTSALIAANEKPVKTEATLEINKSQPAVTKNNTDSGSYKITSNKPANLNKTTAPIPADEKPVKTEAILEINKSQPAVTKNNTDSSSYKITSNQSAILNKTSAPIAANDKPVKTEATLEINKSHPAVTKNNTDSGSNKITSNKPANLNTKSASTIANEKPLKTEATLKMNKLQPAVVKNNTKAANSKITSSEPVNLNTKSLSVTANDKPIKTEATSKVSELQPAFIKNNTSKTALNGAKTSLADVNDKSVKKEATSGINNPQGAITKNKTKTGGAASKIASNEPANKNTNTLPVAATDKHIKAEAPKIDKLQTGSKKNNTYKIPRKKPTNINTKIPPGPTTAASNSIKTENTSNTDESQNNTNNKSISNTVRNIVKKNKKSKNPVAKTENSSSDGVNSIKQEDVALAPWYMESIEKRMFEYLNQKYTVITCMHRGYFSNIYKCKGENGQLYALKVLAARFRSMGMYKDKMLTDLQKSVKDRYHLLKIINNFNFSGEWCFLSEYYPTNLQQVLECKRSFHIDMVQVLSRQLVAAVSTLTSNQIIHTDIKPAHILLNSTNDQLKLCGFDRSDYNYNVKIIPSFGTSSYRAPEVILGFDANYSIDVWATALVIHEMATGSQLFPGHYNNDILYKQLSTLGPLPFDMVEQSKCAYVHFYGTNFKRQIGDGKWRFEEFHGINNNVRTKLFESYHRDWAIGKTSWEITVDLDKIEMLHRLMERMLIMDPRHRIPIAFAGASEFICDYNVFI